MNLKTFTPRASQIRRDWHVIDATGRTLGRLATEVATLLKGKHKPIYAPHMDTGDHVVIVNAERINVTGRKLQQKLYFRYSGYPGGLKSRTLEQQLAKFPERVLEAAIWGMLPHGALGHQMIRKLHVYAGPNHPHQGQVAEMQARRAEAPAVQTEARAGPAEAPAEQAEAPAEQTEAPAEQTEAPAEQTQALAGQTEALAEQAEALAGQTHIATQEKESAS